MVIAVGGIAVSVLVRTLVEGIETVGLPSRDAPVAALVAGLILGLVAAVVAGDTTVGGLLTYAVVGLSSGLGAVGVDAGVKRASGGSGA